MSEVIKDNSVPSFEHLQDVTGDKIAVKRFIFTSVTQFQALTFSRAIRKSDVSELNYDTPESGLDGLLQVVIKTIISSERTRS